MSAFFFGDAARQLFGYYHAPAPGLDRSMAVLICAPLGQEYLRAHRCLVQVSNFLARNHIHVMRFDYSGTGDSWGDLLSVSVEDWLEDISLAIEKLTELSAAISINLLGIRFGATLVSRMEALPAAVTGRIHWDPVINGKDYLNQMQQIQKQRIGDSNLFVVDRRSVLPPHKNDLLGFHWSEALLAEMAETHFDNSMLPNHLLLSKDYLQQSLLQDMGVDDQSMIRLDHASHWHESDYLESQVIQPQLGQLLSGIA